MRHTDYGLNRAKVERLFNMQEFIFEQKKPGQIILKELVMDRIFEWGGVGCNGTWMRLVGHGFFYRFRGENELDLDFADLEGEVHGLKGLDTDRTDFLFASQIFFHNYMAVSG